MTTNSPGTRRMRDCVECGYTFTGRHRRCLTCQAPLRNCAGCGKQFRGRSLRCGDCHKVERACIDCGAIFRSEKRRCDPCRTPERECADCGRLFKGTRRRCQGCTAPDRSCVQCGESFRGAHLRCGQCRRIERACTVCGKQIKRTTARCDGCRTTERTMAGYLRRAHSRRARKLSAQVAGPVPVAVYMRIRAEAECVYCGRAPGTVDHVRPLARGGDEAECNLVPACRVCNSSKRHRLLTEWRPDRVARAVACSEIVRAEWDRLMTEGVAA